jgi:hypothetical protein
VRPLRADNGHVMSEHNVEVLRELFVVWARGEFAMTHLFDPQVEYARIASDDPGTNGEWRGLHEMSAAHLEWLRAWGGRPL